jgi:hypothetical protein
MASLEATLSGVSFPQDDTIVEFPKRKPEVSRHQRGWFGAAAAVALAGAVTALLIPNHPARQAIVDKQPSEPVATTAPRGGALVPAEFRRGLSEASDEGVVWNGHKQPHRVLRVVYHDRVTLKDAAGHTYQVEQPRVEYILVPAKTN